MLTGPWRRDGGGLRRRRFHWMRRQNLSPLAKCYRTGRRPPPILRHRPSDSGGVRCSPVRYWHSPSQYGTIAAIRIRERWKAMDSIDLVAERLGVAGEHLIPYGRYKAKISLDAINHQTAGKLVVVTGITPTPAGEGKTTTAIGLTQGLGRLGYRPVVNLREPALGPIFGIKGGGAGGGQARIVPEDEINIHFTGDAHAVGSAHNLLAALVDNAVYRNQACDLAPEGIQWEIGRAHV